MTRTPNTNANGGVVTVKPQPNVYTLLIVIAILMLGVTIGLCLYTLMAEPPAGYGMTFGQMFDTLEALN